MSSKVGRPEAGSAEARERPTGTHDRGSGTRDTAQIEGALRPSQALPLITEELAAAHTHSTTPVLPPNPIQREREIPGISDTVVAQRSAQGTRINPETPERRTAGTGSPARGEEDVAAADRDGEDDGKEKKEKSESGLSITQLLAGAGAAATSSVIGGQLGVAGTVVGAAAASVITAVAVTIYSKSLDKGKEKVKDVGSKLAPAVKVAPANVKDGKPLASLLRGTAFRRPGTEVKDAKAGDVPTTRAFGAVPDGPNPAGSDSAGRGGTAVDGTGVDGTAADESADVAEDKEPRTWLQKLRRKRVLYPVAIGAATFCVGLGIVVAAESFTEADISPGTSQISNSVTGTSSEDTGDTGDSGGSSGSDSGSTSSGGSQSGSDSSQQGTSSGSQESTSASNSESGTSTDSQSSTNQTTDTANTSSEGTSSTSDSSGSTTSSSSSTSDSAQSGTADGSSSSGSSSSSADTSGSGTSSSGSGSSGSGTSSGSGSSSSGSSSAGGSGSVAAG
ncbi:MULTISPECIES: hypothetical protein [Brevibacterium]|uniref:hypothetical protein n=1 Tax=Brevibacterium TaxID=1696 RepID=UPI000DE9301F|nr:MULTISPECIES: hypothetical protein [Brevibacterium]